MRNFPQIAIGANCHQPSFSAKSRANAPDWATAPRDSGGDTWRLDSTRVRRDIGSQRFDGSRQTHRVTHRHAIPSPDMPIAGESSWAYTAMRRATVVLVAIFVPPHARSLEISGTKDVFAEANEQGRYAKPYRVQVMAETSGPLTCASGLRILPDRTIADDDEPIDTLIVIGPRQTPKPPTPAVTAWLRHHASTARRYGSICTGAFLLGAAGLLEGKRVTTHRKFADTLAAAYPSAIVQADRMFTRDGSLFTSSGVNAGMDLTLALVEEDYGRGLALAVARQLVTVLKRSGWQAQFSAQSATRIAGRPAIQQTQKWIQENIAADLSGAKLAQYSGMSGRNFTRRFRKEVGMTPADFVEAMRVDAARRLLTETQLPLKSVAAGTGLAGTDRLRRAFLRRLGVGPLEYRFRFRFTE